MVFKKIDRYIIRKYISSFIFTVFLITMVAIAMDVSEKINRFLSNNLSFKTVVLEYYVHFIPWINGELWPLFAFLSVIFFSSRMARDSEIIAILNSGVSYIRLLRPMLLAALIIAGLHWAGENLLIPKSTNLMTEFESEYIKRTIKSPLSNNVQFYISPGVKLYCRYYQTRDSSLQTFRLEQFNHQGELIAYMKSKNLKFKEEPNLWTARDYEIRYFNGLEESIELGIGETLDTILPIHPDDFVRHSKQMEIMTTPNLRKHIAREKTRGLDNTTKYRIEVYKRTAGSFTILILTIIGACIGTRKVRGGLGMHLAVGVALGALFVLISKFSETFASNLSFAPLLGVWTPNILFGFISLWLVNKAQK